MPVPVDHPAKTLNRERKIKREMKNQTHGARRALLPNVFYFQLTDTKIFEFNAKNELFLFGARNEGPMFVFVLCLHSRTIVPVTQSTSHFKFGVRSLPFGRTGHADRMVWAHLPYFSNSSTHKHIFIWFAVKIVESSTLFRIITHRHREIKLLICLLACAALRCLPQVQCAVCELTCVFSYINYFNLIWWLTVYIGFSYLRCFFYF